MMSAPTFVAYRIPAMMVPNVPAPSLFSTFTAIRLAPGAMLAVRKAFEAMTDATWVPCKLSSPQVGHGAAPHDPANWFGVKAKLRARSTRPCISGWVYSTRNSSASVESELWLRDATLEKVGPRLGPAKRLASWVQEAASTVSTSVPTHSLRRFT